jgi:hypothetical protein
MQREAGMDKRPVPDAEQPKAEPEIIPPGDPRARSGHAHMWQSADGTQRIYVARVSPFGFTMVLFLAALTAMIFFLLVIGAFVLLLPLAGLIIAFVILSALLRGPFSRLR